MNSRPLLIALAAHVIVLIAALPRSPWEFDEPLFFQALHRYDPVAHHPPPPGYPVFILVGQFLRYFIPSDFATLLTISFIGSVVGFVMLALAFRNLSGDLTTGVVGALLFYFSPAMLIHSTLPISEPGALALLATTLYFATRADSPASFAAFAALTIGWRIQFAIFVVPLFLVQLVLMRRWRDRGIAFLTFTLVCAAWLIPLASAVGGLDDLVQFERGQGKVLAAHDAEESRTGWTPTRILYRFITHPWGPRILSFPVLALAAVGAMLLVRRRAKAWLPLALAGAVYIGFALRVLDPADGARYAIPFLLLTAFLTAVAAIPVAERLQLRPYILPIVFACGSLIYVSAVLSQRSTSDSPPVRAAKYARATLPPSAVILYDLALWPHATYYLADHHPMRINDGLARYFDRPDVPLVTYADGPIFDRDARVFRWVSSDAYRKLTRNHYAAVSLLSVTPDRRIKPLRGVYAIERALNDESWRWLGPSAEIELPNGGARTLTLRIGLPRHYVFDSNQVTISINGQPVRTVRLVRDERLNIDIPIPSGSPILRIESARSYVPAEIPGRFSRDRRRLAVMLLGLTTSGEGADAMRQAVSR